MHPRRGFLKNTGTWTAGGLLGAGATADAISATPSVPDNGGAGGSKPGISTHSYWHFDGEPLPIKHVIDEASAIGVGGVDVLHRQMTQEDPASARELRRYALSRGVNLICLSTHQDFVTPDAQERTLHVNHTKQTLDLADQMGIPCIRVNSERWDMVESFDAPMERGGNEPPLEGYTQDDAFEWCIEAFKRCVPAARERGMALENHWGLTSSAEGVLRIVEAVDSPWLQGLADTGNFPDRPTNSWKCWPLTPFWCRPRRTTGAASGTRSTSTTSALPRSFARGFQGYVTLEFEGTADPASSVRKSLSRIAEAFRA